MNNLYAYFSDKGTREILHVPFYLLTRLTNIGVFEYEFLQLRLDESAFRLIEQGPLVRKHMEGGHIVRLEIPKIEIECVYNELMRGNFYRAEQRAKEIHELARDMAKFDPREML